MTDKQTRLDYAKKSLKGLALGDCFGQTFFGKEEAISERIMSRTILDAPWHFTDDTVMGISIYKVLKEYGTINPDVLAKYFGENYLKDWHRGYGGTAHSILRAIGEGEDWREVSPKVFDGMGSMGNGAAMRAGVIGAYFYDDLEQVAEQARRSAEVTHYNPEGIAGAVACAVAAALMLRQKLGLENNSPEAFIRSVAEHVPESDTKYKIRKACEVHKESHIDFIVSVLGNGSGIIAQDTLPLSIWCAAHYRDQLEEALWRTVSALGDRDTTCAIVGSIVILNNEEVPGKWFEYMENPETSIFY